MNSVRRSDIISLSMRQNFSDAVNIYNKQGFDQVKVIYLHISLNSCPSGFLHYSFLLLVLCPFSSSSTKMVRTERRNFVAHGCVLAYCPMSIQFQNKIKSEP